MCHLRQKVRVASMSTTPKALLKDMHMSVGTTQLNACKNVKFTGNCPLFLQFHWSSHAILFLAFGHCLEHIHIVCSFMWFEQINFDYTTFNTLLNLVARKCSREKLLHEVSFRPIPGVTTEGQCENYIRLNSHASLCL